MGFRFLQAPKEHKRRRRNSKEQERIGSPSVLSSQDRKSGPTRSEIWASPTDLFWVLDSPTPFSSSPGKAPLRDLSLEKLFFTNKINNTQENGPENSPKSHPLQPVDRENWVEAIELPPKGVFPQKAGRKVLSKRLQILQKASQSRVPWGRRRGWGSQGKRTTKLAVPLGGPNQEKAAKTGRNPGQNRGISDLNPGKWSNPEGTAGPNRTQATRMQPTERLMLGPVGRNRNPEGRVEGEGEGGGGVEEEENLEFKFKNSSTIGGTQKIVDSTKMLQIPRKSVWKPNSIDGPKLARQREGPQKREEISQFGNLPRQRKFECPRPFRLQARRTRTLNRSQPAQLSPKIEAFFFFAEEALQRSIGQDSALKPQGQQAFTLQSTIPERPRCRRSVSVPGDDQWEAGRNSGQEQEFGELL